MIKRQGLLYSQDPPGLMADGSINIGTPEQMAPRMAQVRREIALEEAGKFDAFPEEDDMSDLNDLDEIFRVEKLRARIAKIRDVIQKAGFDPNEPRDKGKWTTGGGSGKASDDRSSTHAGPGYSASARVRKGVIYTNSVYDAQLALFENKRVELDQERKISTLIQQLGKTAADMANKGEAAPNFNLCNVSVAGTNLFCADTKGIPRIEMPQMDAVKTKLFRNYLKEQGYKVEKDKVRSIYLRASQNELVGVKVAAKVAKMKAKGIDTIPNRLIVSKDDYIVDGHHKWATQLALDAEKGNLDKGHKMKISRVNIGIIPLLKLAMKFTGGKGTKAGTV